jgi:hypothetical protein
MAKFWNSRLNSVTGFHPESFEAPTNSPTTAGGRQRCYNLENAYY